MADPSVGPEAESESIPVSYYIHLIKRYRWRILSFVLLVTTGVALYSFTARRVYEAEATVRVDTNSLPGVRQADQSSQPSDPLLLVSTEEEVITSPAVVIGMIHTLHLEQDKEFQPGGSNIAELGVTGTLANQHLLQLVTKHIRVTHPPETLLLDIHFQSQDPVLAARAANELARRFIEHEYSTRSDALRDASRSMVDQLAALRAKMENDQLALVHYEAQSGVVDPDDKTNIMQARLAQLNDEFGKAQADAIRAEADAALVKTRTLDALFASSHGDALLPLYNRYIQDRRQLARVGTIYGPKHPLYMRQAETVASDRRLLDQERNHVVAQISEQYNTARLRENLLKQALDQQKKGMDVFNLKAVKYRTLKAAADGSSKLYYDLQARIQDANLSSNVRMENLRVVSPAEPNPIPVYPRIALSIISAFFLSGLLAIGATIAVGILDKSVSTPDQVALWYKLPTLAQLPERSASAIDAKVVNTEALAVPNSQPLLDAFREALLSLHSTLLFSTAEGLTTIAITSTLPGEGKTTVSTQLAQVFASLGTDVLLIDADMRKPAAHRVFQQANRVGLSSVLQRRVTLEEAIVNLPGNSGLRLLPAGPPPDSPPELLHMHFGELLEEVKRTFRYIIVDCPPVLGLADAPLIAGMADATMIVVHAGSTDRDILSSALRQLKGTRSSIVGVVLNRVTKDVGNGYYSYSEYTASYYSNREAENE